MEVYLREKGAPLPEGIYKAGSVYICYGKSGTGKTYTTRELLEKTKASLSFPIELTAVQLYNGIGTDLFSLTPVKKIGLLTISRASSLDKLNKLLEIAYSRIHYSKTKLNDRSSRSHVLLFLKDKKKRLTTLVDLAGSENVAKAESSLPENRFINLSLLALTSTLHALANKLPFVNFRESILTLFLRDVLRLAKRVVFIGCVSIQRDFSDRATLALLETVKLIDLVIIRKETGENEEVEPSSVGGQLLSAEVYKRLYLRSLQLMREMVK